MSSTDTIPSDCEVCSIIKFLSAKGVNGFKIHRRRLCVKYGEGNVTSLWSISNESTYLK